MDKKNNSNQYDSDRFKDLGSGASQKPHEPGKPEAEYSKSDGRTLKGWDREENEKNSQTGEYKRSSRGQADINSIPVQPEKTGKK